MASEDLGAEAPNSFFTILLISHLVLILQVIDIQNDATCQSIMY